MIHKETFSNLQRDIRLNPEQVNQILLTFFTEHGDMLNATINFEVSTADVINDLWWLRRLAIQPAVPGDADVIALTLTRLDSIEAEYWVNFQSQLRNTYLVPETEFAKVINAWRQAVQQDETAECDLQPFKQFWDTYRNTIVFIMDNDDVFGLLDEFFKNRHSFTKADVNYKTAQLVYKWFQKLMLRYSVKNQVLTHL